MKSMQDFHVILAFSTPTGIEEMLYLRQIISVIEIFAAQLCVLGNV